MRTIHILGTGCPKCRMLLANATTAAAQLNGEVTVAKVESIAEIMKFGVMMTPALAIDGQIKSAGKVLSVEEILKLLQ